MSERSERADVHSNPRRFRLSSPAAAGIALTLALVAGTLIGIRLADGSGPTTIALPAASTTPITSDAPVLDTAPSPARRATSPARAASPGSTATAPARGLAPDARVCIANTDVPVDDGGEYLAITSPGSGCSIVGPSFIVSGKARIFEAAFVVDVTQNNVVVHSANVSASVGAPSLGTWSTMFSLPPGNYRIEAYGLSPEDGSRYVKDTIWITVAGPAAKPAPAP